MSDNETKWFRNYPNHVTQGKRPHVENFHLRSDPCQRGKKTLEAMNYDTDIGLQLPWKRDSQIWSFHVLIHRKNTSEVPLSNAGFGRGANFPYTLSQNPDPTGRNHVEASPTPFFSKPDQNLVLTSCSKQTKGLGNGDREPV